MDSIGNLATGVVRGAASLSPTCSAGRPARRNAPLPPLVDRECDVDIPRRVLGNWTPRSGLRELVRPLTSNERAMIEYRAAELRSALAPYHEDERNSVGAAIAEMLASFRSMRMAASEWLATAESVARFLTKFPAWAIREACYRIRAGEAVLNPPLDKRFAPNDNQIRDVVKLVVGPYERALVQAHALLNAPVEANGNSDGGEIAASSATGRGAQWPAA